MKTMQQGLVHVGTHFRQSGCHNKKRHPTTIPPIAKKDPAEEHQIKEDWYIAKSINIEELQALFRKPFQDNDLPAQSMKQHALP
jgi:hypothetical protein